MMGRDHALSGAVAFAGLALTLLAALAWPITDWTN